MNLRANMLGQLFPGICLLCRRRSKRGIDLCRECELAFEANHRACPLCAEPTPVSSADGRCGACVAAPPPWAKTVAPFLYTAPLSTLVEGLKSGNGLLQARILGALLADAVQTRYADEPLPDALIPVPLTRKRRLQRGFNQAELLANVVGRTLRLPRHLSLARIKNAPPQRTLARCRTTAQRARRVCGSTRPALPAPGGGGRRDHHRRHRSRRRPGPARRRCLRSTRVGGREDSSGMRRHGRHGRHERWRLPATDRCRAKRADRTNPAWNTRRHWLKLRTSPFSC